MKHRIQNTMPLAPNEEIISPWASPGFKRMFSAHCLSLAGSALTVFALGLLAHDLVGESASTMLGNILFIRIAVIIFISPLAGRMAELLGPKKLLVISDLARSFIVVGFFFADTEWQIYLLALALNFGSALFTPVYKAIIPGLVGQRAYPTAVAYGTVAYNLSEIIGPAIAAGLVAVLGFRWNFTIDALTFFFSALLLAGVVLDKEGKAAKSLARAVKEKKGISVLQGIQAMFRRAALRQSLFLYWRVSVVSGFVLVATIDYVKEELELANISYSLAFAPYGIGAILGAFLYSRMSPKTRISIRPLLVILCLLSFSLVAIWTNLGVLLVAWFFAGIGQNVYMIISNEILAAHTAEEERGHVFAAHFSLGHAGWGVTYPLTGFLVPLLGFHTSAWIFAGLFAMITLAAPLKTFKQPSDPSTS